VIAGEHSVVSWIGLRAGRRDEGPGNTVDGQADQAVTTRDGVCCVGPDADVSDQVGGWHGHEPALLGDVIVPRTRPGVLATPMGRVGFCSERTAQRTLPGAELVLVAGPVRKLRVVALPGPPPRGPTPDVSRRRKVPTCPVAEGPVGSHVGCRQIHHLTYVGIPLEYRSGKVEEIWVDDAVVL